MDVPQDGDGTAFWPGSRVSIVSARGGVQRRGSRICLQILNQAPACRRSLLADRRVLHAGTRARATTVAAFVNTRDHAVDHAVNWAPGRLPPEEHTCVVYVVVAVILLRC